MGKPIRLDDWYRCINSIYLDRNFYRTPESIFCHLVEVVGGLSIVASGKTKPGVKPKEYLAKALGWWMALCGKVGVKSVETMVWAKFPYSCPYCHEAPHVPSQCRRSRQVKWSPDWDKLKSIADKNKERQPTNLSEWQKMFDVIYPRSDQTTHERNFSRLTEELGELSEAIRVLPITRAYFLNEAADVFAWLIGTANQLHQDIGSVESRGESLEEVLYKEYPAACRHCGSESCKCPPILKGTLGRIAHEIPASVLSPERGGALFTVEEALEFFRLGDKAIMIAGQHVPVTPEVLEEVMSTSRVLLDKIKGVEKSQIGVHAKLVTAITQLESLASRQELTQESADAILKAINELPSETRNTVISFLNNAAAGVWVQALLTALGLEAR